MRKVLRGFELVIGCLGLLAIVNLATINEAHPPLRIMQVSGQSMEPTLHDGEQLVFGRFPWHLGGVVLAEVEEGPVVKRVVGLRKGNLLLSGDNKEISATYEVPPESLIGILFCRSPFHSPFAQGRAEEEP